MGTNQSAHVSPMSCWRCTTVLRALCAAGGAGFLDYMLEMLYIASGDTRRNTVCCIAHPLANVCSCDNAPLKMSESPGFGEALSAFCQKVWNLDRYQSVPLVVTSDILQRTTSRPGECPPRTQNVQSRAGSGSQTRRCYPCRTSTSSWLCK